MIIGVLLIVLGSGGYVVTGGSSLTALIPAAFGIAYLGLGYVGEHREHLRPHAMHIAAFLSLLGIVGNVSALVSFPSLVMGEDVPHSTAVITRFLMALICAVHLVATIRSFMKARLIPQHS